MKKSILFASFIVSCMWFNETLAQVIVARRHEIYRPHRAVVVKPPVLVQARRVVVVKSAPVIIPVPARVVGVAPIRPHRRVVVYR